MIIFNTFSGTLVEIIIALVSIVIVYYKWTYQYWKKKNIPHQDPVIPYGNIKNPLFHKENTGITLRHKYEELKAKGWRHAGLYSFTTCTYFVLDLDYVRNIMTKDFHHFTDRGFYYNEEDDPLSGHLFNLGGSKWKNLRAKLSPTFTSGKMKTMFQALLDCIPNLLDKVENDIEKNQPTDIKEALGCFMTDVIGSCAFGLDCNSFRDSNSPFRVYGKKAFTFSTWSLIKMIFATSFPRLARCLSVTITPKDVSDFFINMVNDTVNYREKNNVTRKDFLQLLIDLKNNKLAEEEGYKHDGRTLTIEELAAQCFVFFIAGFETSSNMMTFTLYELARRQEIQEKLRKEVNTVLAKHGGKITYEAVQEMKYMDQVINESLRMYPPVPMLLRTCVKDYKIPDQDVIIEKGTPVIIPVTGIHYDKDYYPDPDDFDPERFSEEMKSSRHPYAHIPFGEGPRNCIGLRFGLMQSKVGLTSLLKHYKFTVNKKTKEPLKWKINTLITTAEDDVWLDAQKI